MLFIPVLSIEKIDLPEFTAPDDSFDRYELEIEYYTQLIIDHAETINSAIGESMHDVYSNPDGEYREPYGIPSEHTFWTSELTGIFEPLQEFQGEFGYGNPESMIRVYVLENGDVAVWLQTDNDVSPDIIIEHFKESGLDESVNLFGAEYSGIELLKNSDAFMFENVLSEYADNLGYEVN